MEYEVLRKVPLRGRVYEPGAIVELHPRQAKYLVVQGKLRAKAAAGQGKKKASKENSDG